MKYLTYSKDFIIRKACMGLNLVDCLHKQSHKREMRAFAFITHTFSILQFINQFSIQFQETSASARPSSIHRSEDQWDMCTSRNGDNYQVQFLSSALLYPCCKSRFTFTTFQASPLFKTLITRIMGPGMEEESHKFAEQEQTQSRKEEKVSHSLKRSPKQHTLRVIHWCSAKKQLN
jgi:hypothetical protein